MPKKPATVRCKGEEKADGASNLKKRLLKALAKGADVEVDGSKLADLDGVALQVLVAAKKSALSQGQDLRIVKPSPFLSRILALTQLERIFGL